MKKEKIWRCDLKEPCIKFCESEHNKHQCGIYLKDKKLKEEKCLKITQTYTQPLNGQLKKC